MTTLNERTLTAIKNHSGFVFNNTDGTEDIDAGLRLLNFTTSMIEEMSDLGKQLAVYKGEVK